MLEKPATPRFLGISVGLCVCVCVWCVSRALCTYVCMHGHPMGLARVSRESTACFYRNIGSRLDLGFLRQCHIWPTCAHAGSSAEQYVISVVRFLRLLSRALGLAGHIGRRARGIGVGDIWLFFKAFPAAFPRGCTRVLHPNHLGVAVGRVI